MIIKTLLPLGGICFCWLFITVKIKYFVLIHPYSKFDDLPQININYVVKKRKSIKNIFICTTKVLIRVAQTMVDVRTCV